MKYAKSCFIVRTSFLQKRWGTVPVGAIWYVGLYKGEVTVKLQYNPNSTYIPKFDKLLYSFKLTKKQ